MPPTKKNVTSELIAAKKREVALRPPTNGTLVADNRPQWRAHPRREWRRHGPPVASSSSRKRRARFALG